MKKKKKKKNTTVGKIKKLKNQIKISEREKIVSPNIQIHDSSLFWFGTGTSIKYVTIKVFKLVLWVQTSLLGEVINVM